MNREELEAYILNHYSTEPDYPSFSYSLHSVRITLSSYTSIII